MNAFVATHMDFLITIFAVAMFGFGYYFGDRCKGSENEALIREYENLLDLAYEEKLNLVQTIASMGKRSQANLCECDTDFEPFIADAACTCQVCEILRND